MPAYKSGTIIFNNVVDVAFNLLIDNVELVDNEFKLLNIVVDVLFKLLIDNIELVDNEFKLLKIVVDVDCKFDILNIFKNFRTYSNTNRIVVLVS